MPAKQKHFMAALAKYTWIEPYMQSDPCLFDILMQACISKEKALAANGDPTIIANGNRTLDAIRDGQEKDVWYAATTAVRHFTEARLTPRKGHALRRRYGRTKKPGVKTRRAKP